MIFKKSCLTLHPTRHAQLNDIIKRALLTAGVPSLLEPSGLSADNAIRPDGITVFPFSEGKSMCWDATCWDTFSASAINDAAHTAGTIAAKAEKTKVAKYATLQDRYRFVPIAFETTGIAGEQTDKFISELGRRMAGNTGNRREVEWLRQRLSMAIIRGNAASIQATGQLNPGGHPY